MYPRKHSIFIVRPDYSQPSTYFPGIDSPIVLDSYGLLFQRQGLSGDFAVCLNPTLPREAKKVRHPLSYSCTSSLLTIFAQESQFYVYFASRLVKSYIVTTVIQVK